MSGPSTAPADSATVKSCCAAVYGSEWVRALLGDSFHPGGIALTERLGRLVGLAATDVVLDVAAGRGTSAIALAERFRCRVVGVDLSPANVAAAGAAARAAGVDDVVRFVCADGEGLPFADASFDVVLCECAFCTFPDKPRAAAEMARLLRPGGRLGISDLTRTGELPETLQTLVAWVACIADALPVDTYLGHMATAGLLPRTVEHHDDALVDLVERIRGRLQAAALVAELGRLPFSVEDLRRAEGLALAARDCVATGTLGYAIMTATRPST